MVLQKKAHRLFIQGVAARITRVTTMFLIIREIEIRLGTRSTNIGSCAPVLHVGNV